MTSKSSGKLHNLRLLGYALLTTFLLACFLVFLLVYDIKIHKWAATGVLFAVVGAVFLLSRYMERRDSQRRGAAGSDIIAAHHFSSHHRRSLMQSEKCGCFYCLAIFSPAEITEWTDDGDTALCPKCGIDSVIGSNAGFPITEGFLGKMQRHWFYSPAR